MRSARGYEAGGEYDEGQIAPGPQLSPWTILRTNTWDKGEGESRPSGAVWDDPGTMMY